MQTSSTCRACQGDNQQLCNQPFRQLIVWGKWRKHLGLQQRGPNCPVNLRCYVAWLFNNPPHLQRARYKMDMTELDRCCSQQVCRGDGTAANPRQDSSMEQCNLDVIKGEERVKNNHVGKNLKRRNRPSFLLGHVKVASKLLHGQSATQ